MMVRQCIINTVPGYRIPVLYGRRQEVYMIDHHHDAKKMFVGIYSNTVRKSTVRRLEYGKQIPIPK